MSDAGATCKQPHAPPLPARGTGAPRDPATPGGAALRTTAACVVAMALALALHVEMPALAVVFVLARGNAGALTMLAGGLGGAAAAVVLLDVFDQSPAGMSVALFVVTSLATYLALGRRFPYAFVQGLLLLLVVVGQSLDTPDEAVRHAFYDLASVVLAALAAFVAGASQPVAIPARLQAALAAEVAACAALLAAPAAGAARTALRVELLARQARSLLALAWPTRLVSRARRRALGAATALADDVAHGALALRALASSPRPAADAAAIARLAQALAGGAARVADVLPAVHGPVDVGRAERRGRTRTAALAARRAALAAPAHLPGVAWVARSLGRRLARLAATGTLLVPGAHVTITQGPAAWRPPLVDRFRLRHAVKSGASYLLVLWAWVAAGWGAVVPALVVSVLVATLATPLGATLRKAVLRVGGVLAGGAIGLTVAIVLLPWITSLPAMCAVTGLGLLGFLLVQQRDERLAFAALQAAIAFPLTLVHGPGPDASTRGPLDSLIGLAFGILVVVLVMHAEWPLDAASSARRSLGAVVARAGERLAGCLAGRRAAGDPTEREARAAREHAAGFAHEVELYGTQFGRPADDLAMLFLHAAQADALATLLAAAPPAADARACDASAAAIARAALLLGDALAALPGEPPPAGLAPALAAAAAEADAIASQRTSADPGAAVRAEVVCALALVLLRLADEMARATGEAGPARRAA